MIITRTIGQTLLGKPTLTQIGLTCVLASIWGFLPGFEVAPLSVVLMVLLLLVLNANLALAAIMTALARILALLVMPLTFKLGVALIEGPLGNLFKSLINGSGTALMGFDYYITAGSWTVGLVWGLVSATFLTRRIGSFRNLIENLDENSETYQKYSQKGWMRFLGWLVFGVDLQKVKPNFEAKGGPIRIMGVVLVALSVAGVVYATPLVEAFVAKQMKAGLERGNGATVDVGKMELKFSDNRLSITNLEMADPENLGMNRFRADAIEVDLSVSDLFARRIVLDRVEASGAAMNVPREKPGVRISPPAKERKDMDLEMPDYETLESYWQQAKELKAKLREARDFFETISGEDEVLAEDSESFEEWLAREVAAKGYEWVRALNKIEGSPAFMVRHFKAHDVKHGSLNGDVLHIDAHNLSTHPEFAGGPARIEIRSGQKTFEAMMSFDEALKGQEQSKLRFAYRGLPMETVTSQLKESAEYLQGGHINFGLEGGFRLGNGSYIDLPLEARLFDVTLHLPKVNPVTLNDFPVTVMVKGPLDNPHLKFDHKAFIETLRKRGFDAVVDSYKQQLRDEVDARVEEEKDKIVDKAKEKLGEELGDKVGSELGDQLGNEVGGLLGGKKDKKEASGTEEKKDPGAKKDKPDVGGLLGGLLDQKAKEKEGSKPTTEGEQKPKEPSEAAPKPPSSDQ